MKHQITIRFAALLGLLLLLAACGVSEPKADTSDNACPEIFPDYVDVTIPHNIAPLRFRITMPADEAVAAIGNDDEGKIVVSATGSGSFIIPEGKWHSLLNTSKGKSIEVVVYTRNNGQWCRHKAFKWHVSADEADPYLVYRLIPPGYELWNKMGIYQRNITNFDEQPIVVNSRFEGNCMNCHSFNQRNPEQMLFHMRAKHGGTYFVDNGKVRRVDGHLSDKFQSLVYPYWHPSGRFVAFSSNTTRQAFQRADCNRVEVFDQASDVLVYDIEHGEALSDSLIASNTAFETFPTFSPDGKLLYFCTSDTCALPDGFRNAHYSLCSLPFDASSRSFGNQVDTLVNCHGQNLSVSFPRVSPDGHFLVYTLASYGNFSIWHRDADLHILNINTRQSQPLIPANSNDVESYHSWSANSRWLVFSSRRMDGLYTRPFMVHIDAEGNASKPFVLPQESPEFYDTFMYSFNIPEFVSAKVKISSNEVAEACK